MSGNSDKIPIEEKDTIGIEGLKPIAERETIYKFPDQTCPEGYHWVSRAKDGSRKGHCAKNPKRRFGFL